MMMKKTGKLGRQVLHSLAAMSVLCAGGLFGLWQCRGSGGSGSRCI